MPTRARKRRRRAGADHRWRAPHLIDATLPVRKHLLNGAVTPELGDVLAVGSDSGPIVQADRLAPGATTIIWTVIVRGRLMAAPVTVTLDDAQAQALFACPGDLVTRPAGPLRQSAQALRRLVYDTFQDQADRGRRWRHGRPQRRDRTRRNSSGAILRDTGRSIAPSTQTADDGGGASMRRANTRATTSSATRATARGGKPSSLAQRVPAVRAPGVADVPASWWPEILFPVETAPRGWRNEPAHRPVRRRDPTARERSATSSAWLTSAPRSMDFVKAVSDSTIGPPWIGGQRSTPLNDGRGYAGRVRRDVQAEFTARVVVQRYVSGDVVAEERLKLVSAMPSRMR